MKLTPIEIKNQEFKKGMRGYDTVEVETFIELIADKYQELLNENEQLLKRNLIMESELANIKDVERTLKQTLQNVQENSQVSKENSQKEAGLLIKEAELAAAQIRETSRMQVLKMKEELVTLQNQKHSFISRLRHVLASQMELLEVLKTDDIDLSQLKNRTKPIQRNAEHAQENRLKELPTQNSAGSGQIEKPEKTQNKDLLTDIFGKSKNQ